MGKFNRKLSQLEAMYQVAGPVLKPEQPATISHFITNVFENSEDYGISHLSKDWFLRYSDINRNKAVNFVHNLLQENNQLISKKSILEGIELYKSENKDG